MTHTRQSLRKLKISRKKRVIIKMRGLIFLLATVLVVNLACECYLFEEANPSNLIFGQGNVAKQPPPIKASNLDNVELERVEPMVGGDRRRERELSANYQPSACQLVPVVHLLHHPGCQPKAIASFACSGSCTSYVKTSSSNFWQHERSCSCCQQTGSQEATFALDCPSLDPPYRKVKTHAPVECLCRACTDLGREDLRPQELVEALAGEASSGFNFKTSS